MFDNLTSKLAETFKYLKGHDKLNEKNIAGTLKEVRLALLEADVHYKVAKNFVERIRERAIGQDVIKQLNPSQQVIKIVYEELSALMGNEPQHLSLSGQVPLIFMMVGLQGSGKTTTSAKLALELRRRGRYPYLVSVDVQRPAAIEQLKRLGKEIQIMVLDSDINKSPLDICKQGLLEASRLSVDVIILDTAGRLHVDDYLMAELKKIKSRFNPQEILLIADAMMGQDTVNVVKTFHSYLNLTGVILTKAEGDARGGAALSIKAVTNVPIKFLGIGEKLDALEIFYPERMARRILGMGDLLSLVEKAQQVYDQDVTKELAKKIAKNEFSLEDFRLQLIQIKRLGSLESIIKMLPKVFFLKEFRLEERELNRSEAIINSMTFAERANVRIINASRRKRIAAGSGTTVTDVNRLLKNFSDICNIMKNMNKLGINKKKKRRFLFPINRRKILF